MAERPSRAGLETHLASMYQTVRDFQPSVTIVDAVTNLLSVGTTNDVRAMLMRVIDYLKVSEVTGLFSSLTSAGTSYEGTEAGISSLMDTWIVMTIDEIERERRRAIRILKSRGMAHSNRVHEFAITSRGLRITDDGRK
jgi:circadian clock protein KaiC